MPFTKVGNNTYRSPSGKKFTGKQVKMYYATSGFSKKKLPSKKQLIKEHKELVRVLRTGSKPEQKREAREQSKELKGYQKMKIVVNNKMKGGLGASEFKKGNKPTGKIEINVKKHKGDKAELASTIKHELMHVKHPNMTEKEVYKRTAKTKIAPEEQSKLIAKLKTKRLNYKTGALKRKYKISSSDKIEPGEFIRRANEAKANFKRGVYGLI